MIIQEVLDKTTEVSGGQDIIDQEFALDSESLGIFFKSFSDSIYSDKIGSIVREITSNAVDAHSEAGVKKPVLVGIQSDDLYDDKPSTFFVEDFGTGMSRTRVANTYAKYFASTKRTSNNEIGGFGIGAKSPLSYVDAFTMRTIYDGIKYEYVIHRGEKAPSIKLIYSEETDQPNGTKVEIPIANQTDERKFQSAIYQQLRYFEEVFYVSGVDLSNNSKLYHGKNFIYNPDNSPERMELALGRVAYPINWSQIDLSEITDKYKDLLKGDLMDTPIALKFQIGDLPVTMNRESLEYKDGVAKKIVEKLDQALLELFEITKQNLKTDDLEQYYAMTSYDAVPLDENVDLKVPFRIDKHIVYTPFKAIEAATGIYPDLPENPFFEYQVKQYLAGGKVMKVDAESQKSIDREQNNKISGQKMAFRVDYNLWVRGNTVYRNSEEKISKRKALYIEDIEGKHIYLLTKRDNILKKDVSEAICNLGKLKADENDIDLATEMYQKHILEYIIQHTKSYDRTEIDPKWLEDYELALKKAREEVKFENVSFTIRLLKVSEYSAQYNIKNDVNTDTIRKLTRKGYRFIYGVQGEEYKLERLYAILSNVKISTSRKDSHPKGYFWEAIQGLFFVKIAKDNIKYIKDIPNCIALENAYEHFEMDISRAYFLYAYPDLKTQTEAIKVFVPETRLGRLMGAYAAFFNTYKRATPLSIPDISKWASFRGISDNVVFTYDGINFNMLMLNRLLYPFIRENIWIAAMEFSRTTKRIAEKAFAGIQHEDAETAFKNSIKSIINFKMLYGKNYLNAQW